MKKQSKSLLVAIAAFAVTTTGVSAHTGLMVFSESGLDDKQISAFEIARELREEGDLTGARDALLDAGISEDALKKIGKASRKSNGLIKEAVDNDDFNLFLEAVEGSPLADKVASEEDFELFVEAHDLLKEENFKEAREIFDVLGIQRFQDGNHRDRNHRRNVLSELTDEQINAFEAAKEANDKETMRSILDEAGLNYHVR